jgi:hypothetical protein
MTPTALSIITTTFEEGAERNKALGIWGALGGIGATTGRGRSVHGLSCVPVARPSAGAICRRSKS